LRAVVQRVAEASVTVEGRVTGAIGRGFLVLVCAMAGDTEREAEKREHDPQKCFPLLRIML
jgi:D-tyrosyl-tRNA(Tyr) deacylase